MEIKVLAMLPAETVYLEQNLVFLLLSFLICRIGVILIISTSP